MGSSIITTLPSEAAPRTINGVCFHHRYWQSARRLCTATYDSTSTFAYGLGRHNDTGQQPRGTPPLSENKPYKFVDSNPAVRRRAGFLTVMDHTICRRLQHFKTWAPLTLKAKMTHAAPLLRQINFTTCTRLRKSIRKNKVRRLAHFRTASLQHDTVEFSSRYQYVRTGRSARPKSLLSFTTEKGN